MHLGRNLSSRALIIYQEMISLRPQTMILGGGKVKHYVSSVLALHMRCPVGGLGDTHDTATYAEGGKGYMEGSDVVCRDCRGRERSRSNTRKREIYIRLGTDLGDARDLW